MKILIALIFVWLAGVPAWAQDPPKLRDVRRYADGSCGGVLTYGSGSTAFCLEVTAYRTELWLGATAAGRKRARRVAPGSEDATGFLARLERWGQIAFDEKLRTRIAHADEIRRRGHGWSFESFDRYKQAAVLHSAMLYRRIHASRITDVIPGRGTVRLSFKLREGTDARRNRLVTFRSLDGAGLRMHFGDAQQPIAYDSVDERFVLRAMRAYTEKHIAAGDLDLLWQGAKMMPAGVSRETLAVLVVLRDYCHLSSPRLSGALYVQDGGSTIYELVDARCRGFEVKFDKALDSKTKGRMYYRKDSEEWQLVAFGSDREAGLLKGFLTLLPRMPECDRPPLERWLAGYEKLQAARQIKAKRS